VLGCYLLRPNQPGLGDHVANCGYMVAADARGQGIASAMCEHSLDAARHAGFAAMQFNFVAAANTTAVKLWQRHGFEIVGTVPGAFRHATLGPTDIHVMHRFL
jgi:ribosomal protein S18 acetylase RimI-like enzyme